MSRIRSQTQTRDREIIDPIANAFLARLRTISASSTKGTISIRLILGGPCLTEVQADECRLFDGSEAKAARCLADNPLNRSHCQCISHESAQKGGFTDPMSLLYVQDFRRVSSRGPWGFRPQKGRTDGSPRSGAWGSQNQAPTIRLL